MDNDSGRGSRSDEPPPLAMVRRLRPDEHGAHPGIAEDDWYETERLTEQITGGARTTAVRDEPAREPEPTLMLDWRNPDQDPAPSAAQRLRRSLQRRRRIKVRLRLPRADRRLRQGRQTTATMTPESRPVVSPTPTEPEATADRIDPAHSPLAFRHGPQHEQPTPERRPLARVRERLPHPGYTRRVAIPILTLAATATATIGILSAISGSPAKPRRTAILTATRGQAPDLGEAATTLTSAVALIEHYVASSAREDEAVRAKQRARRATHRRSHSVTQRAPTSAARVAAPSSSATADSYGNSYSSTAYTSSYSSPAAAPSATANSYASSSSSPADSGASSPASSSSQPASSGSAPAASTQTTQPAFGQNGTLGPGRGAPGTQ